MNASPGNLPFAFLLLLALAASAGAQRTPDVRISTSPPGGQSLLHPRVAAFGDSLCVVWQNTSNGEIHATRSTDRGATWPAADTRLDVGTAAGDSVAPEVCIAGNAVYVVWEEHRAGAANGDVWFNRSLDSGATWLPAAVRLDVGSGVSAADSRAPKIACAGSIVCVAWQDWRNGAIDVYANRSLDGGTTWLATDVRVDTGDAPGTHASIDPQVSCEGNDVWIVWADERAGALDYDIYLNRSTDGGATWLPAARRLDTAVAGRSATDPQIASIGNDVYVVWEDDRNGLKDIYLTRSTDRGGTWLTADVRLDRGDPPGAGDSVDPRITCSGNAVHVVWTDYRSFVFPQVYGTRSTDGGATWASADTLLNHGTAGCSSTNPQVASTGALVVVVWESQACGGPGRPDVYGVRSTDQGATWLPLDVRLDTHGPGTSNSREPRVAIGSEHPYVVWSDDRNSTVGRSDVYWNLPFGPLSYGPATPGSGNLAPRLTGVGRATLGTSVSIEGASGLPLAPGLLLIGGPGSKVSIPVAGGTLLVLPAVTLPIVVGVGGTFSLPLAIPAGTGNVGANVNLQGLILDAGAPGGVAMTNAVEVWIG